MRSGLRCTSTVEGNHLTLQGVSRCPKCRLRLGERLGIDASTPVALPPVSPRAERTLEQIEEAFQAWKSLSALDHQTIRDSPDIPEHELEALLEGDIDLIRESTAGSASITPELAQRVASRKSFYMRTEIAGNDAAPASVIAQLLDDEYMTVRGAAHETALRKLGELGVTQDNTEAIDALLGAEWWLYSKDSPEVLLILRLHPNP